MIVIAASVFLVLRTFRTPSLPSAARGPSVAVANPYSGPRAQVDALRKGEFLPTNDAPVFEQAIARETEFSDISAGLRAQDARVQALRSGAEAIDDAKGALDRTLMRYLEAFASPDPEVYVALAEREPTRWITPDSTRWDAIDSAMMHWYSRPADRADPVWTLRLLLPVLRARSDYALTRGRIDTQGIDILLWYARVPSDLDRSLIWESSPDRYYFWMFGASNSIRFRDPIVTPGDIIRRDRGVLFAEVFFVLSPDADKPHVWRSVWYWDPSRKEWLNHVNEARSWYSMPMFY